MATRDGLEFSRWNIGVRWAAVKDCEPDAGIAAVPGGSRANVTTPSSIRAVPVPLDARLIPSSSLLPGLTCLPEQAGAPSFSHGLSTCAAGWGWRMSAVVCPPLPDEDAGASSFSPGLVCSPVPLDAEALDVHWQSAARKPTWSHSTSCFWYVHFK